MEKPLGFLATIDYEPVQTGRPHPNKSTKLYPTAGAAWGVLHDRGPYKSIRKVFVVSYSGVYEVDEKGERKG